MFIRRNGVRFASGFTLVELLLVVAIISLLASIILVGVSGARAKARDAKRVGDIKALATAVEYYNNAVGHYPVSATWVSQCDHPGNWLPDGSNFNWSNEYMPAQPRDPLESCNGTIQHKYSYWSNGSTYQLTTTLEDANPAASGGTASQTYAFNGSYFAPYTDTSPITVSISTPVTSPTNQSPIPLTVTFSRAVTDFTQSTLGVLYGVVTGFSKVLASMYNVFVTPTDNNTIVVSVSGSSVHDQNGIGNAPAQFTITYDSLLPHPALSPDPLPASVSAPFGISVNFTVAVDDFGPGKVSVTNGTVTNFLQQDGSNYFFAITPSAPGPLSVSIPAGVVHSAAGNANVGSNIVSTTYAP